MTFDKELYRDRRSRGLRGQTPGSAKEVRQEVRKRVTEGMRTKLTGKIKEAIAKQGEK